MGAAEPMSWVASGHGRTSAQHPADPHRRLQRHTYQEARASCFWPPAPGRLAAEFTRRQIYPLEHNTVSALFARCGTSRPSTQRPRGPRYERGAANELWRIDIKGPFFLRGARGAYTKVWIVGLVDDHSRYLIGLRLLPRPQQAVVLPWLRDCFELCGTPLELMSDNGSPFVVWMPGVLTLFGQTLARTAHPSPAPDQLAVDERQDRARVGHPAARGARSPAADHARGRGCGAGGLGCDTQPPAADDAVNQHLPTAPGEGGISMWHEGPSCDCGFDTNSRRIRALTPSTT
jgi:hypothetical protein